MGKRVKKVRNKPKITPTSRDDSQNIDYPIFCFRHFDETMFDALSNRRKSDFISRLKKLSQFTWSYINTLRRHQYGTEHMPRGLIKSKLPNFVTDDVQKLSVFRYTSDNYPFLGLRRDNVFHILLIEKEFGDVYDHS